MNSPTDDANALTIYFSHSGNTRNVAREVHQTVGGDLVELRIEGNYPSDYNAVLKQAKRELTTGFKPALAVDLGDISSYDVVFVGSPNWYGTIAPPVISFLSEADLSGKTVVPLITHGGGGMQRCAKDLAKLCPGAKVSQPMDIYGADVSAAQTWLKANWPLR